MGQYLEATSLHQEIEEVDVRARRLIDQGSARQLRAGLRGHRFESTRRHGKNLFVRLENDRHLLLHFGMTGNLKYFKDIEEDPEYDRLLVSFASGYYLAYISLRKLGEVELLDDVEAFIERKDLGPDALEVDLKTFKERLSGRRGMVKSRLMSQDIIAGIGNVYSDEILFQAGIHPRTPMRELDEGQIEQIFQIMKRVLKTAIDHKADPRQFPDSYIIPHREVGAQCPKCGGEVQRVKVSGRSAYFCPRCQSRQPGASRVGERGK